jgi:hypothetical protein
MIKKQWSLVFYFKSNLICSIFNSSIIDNENNNWGLLNADNELLSVIINTIGWCATRFNSLYRQKKKLLFFYWDFDFIMQSTLE